MDGLKDVLNRIILDPNNAEILSVVKAARNGAVYGAKVRFPHALVMVFLFRSASYVSSMPLSSLRPSQSDSRSNSTLLTPNPLSSFRDKIRLVLKATRQHARNLATYATIYKLTMLLLRYLPILSSSASSSASDDKPHEGPYDTFIAGLVGGYTVFGRGPQSSVNQQICIYVFARVALALAKLSVQHPSPSSIPGSPQTKGLIPDIGGRVTRNAWPVFASLSWACVMYIFRWHPETIQPSLRNSMKYIVSSWHVQPSKPPSMWFLVFANLNAPGYYSYTNADHWDSLRNFIFHNN
ncbi:MAG: hypothetical protein M1819_005008 [Sarea resinae]|nr:MAG: hypothetical protein M1819_005008 [Sarea resinae]